MLEYIFFDVAISMLQCMFFNVHYVFLRCYSIYIPKLYSFSICFAMLHLKCFMLFLGRRCDGGMGCIGEQGTGARWGAEDRGGSVLYAGGERGSVLFHVGAGGLWEGTGVRTRSRAARPGARVIDNGWKWIYQK